MPAEQSDPDLLAAFEEFDRPQFLEEVRTTELEVEPKPEPILGGVSQPQPEAQQLQPNRSRMDSPPTSARGKPSISPPAVMTPSPSSALAKRREIVRMLDEAQAEVSALKKRPSMDATSHRASAGSPDEVKESVSMFIPFDEQPSAGAKRLPPRLQSARKSTGRGSTASRGGRATGQPKSASGSRGRGTASRKKTANATKAKAAPGAARGRKSAKVPTRRMDEGVPREAVKGDETPGSEPSDSESDAQSLATNAKATSPPAQSPTQPASGSPARHTKVSAAGRRAGQRKVSPPKEATSVPGSATKKKSKAARNVEAIAARREERRAAAAAEKLRADTELAEHGGDRSDLEYRRAVRGFRAAVRRGEVMIPAYRAAAASSRLQVFVRIRPLFNGEDFDVLTKLGRHALVAHRQHLDTQYIFDGILSGKDESFVVSQIAVQQHLDSILQEVTKTCTSEELALLAHKKSAAAAAAVASRHGSPTKVTRHTAIDMPRLTVFAYGQTGSGKTYTMESVSETVISALLQFATDAPALIKAVADSGSAGGGSEQQTEAGAVYVAMTSFEIFADKCYDLLAPVEDGTGLPPLVKAYEDAAGELRLPDLTESLLVDERTAAKMLHRGRLHRRKGANAVHDNSSRSHAITQLEVRDVVNSVALCRFTLVDLAGSERASETMADDAATRQEGAEINKSLLALKECIRALDSSAAHTPFRQSKLTQVLKDSLETLQTGGSTGTGGSGSRAVMIATVSPSASCLDHTLNTLRYADRLKELSGAEPEGAAVRTSR